MVEWTSVASPIICRSALAIEAHRGVASLANTLCIGCALRLALRSAGCAPPTTSDRGRATSAGLGDRARQKPWPLCRHPGGLLAAGFYRGRCGRLPLPAIDRLARHLH